jgi:hypothetical protein
MGEICKRIDLLVVCLPLLVSFISVFALYA